MIRSIIVNQDVNRPDRPVWQREELYRESPTEAPYGYLTGKGELKGFQTLDQLRASYTDEIKPIHTAWTPQSNRFIPISEVSGVLPQLKRKRIEESASRWNSSLINTAIFSCVLLYFAYSGFQESGTDFWKLPSFGIILIVYLSFALSPLYESWRFKRLAKNLSARTLRDESNEVRFERWLANQRSVVTYVMIAFLICATFIQLLSGGFNESSKTAGLVSKDLLGDEQWRVWTAPFLHGGVLHIFMNIMGLKYLGKRVEVLAKWPHLVMAYTLSMVAASYSSLVFLEPGRVGVGASGGILGLLGFLIVFETVHPKLTPRPSQKRLIVVLISVAVMGFLGVTFIDNAAHAGGCLAGALYALVAFPPSSSPHRPAMRVSDKIVGCFACLIYLWALVFTVFKLLGA